MPSPAEMISKLQLNPEKARRILRLMIQDGTLAKVSDDLFVDQKAIDGVVASLRRRKKTEPKLNVGAFKELVGVSRKYAIPLLEYLDQQRVTRRVGNDRVIL